MIRTASVVSTASIMLVACGSRSDSPVSDAAPPPIAAKADVTITIDGVQHVCMVSLASEAQGSSIPCKDVVAFVRDELRVANGSSYDLQLRGAEEAEAAGVRANLQDAGYKPADRRNAAPK